MRDFTELTVNLTDRQVALVYLFASELAESGDVLQAATDVVGFARTMEAVE